ncbi:MAG: hypothetical protein I3274_02710 [Candidatus Moeniiplasma glomeromycotorum]|nr:hypothetical protein [Candidatus Moeniiplasma glomeromycotorum]MCE8167516.1 hypothetical protein [Candidatus Moeniiplasma glomeromycotorum]
MEAKPNQPTKELKSALALVSDYLFNSLLTNPPNTKIKLGSLGYLVKKERTTRNYFYYHIHFQKSRSLKQALDQQITQNV